MTEKIISGTLNKVIKIDLSLKTVHTVSITEEQRRQFLLGKGLGLKLMYDRLKPGIDPLGEENIIILMTGVLAGTFSALFRPVSCNF
jgi:aldehyde:ferredoxin oxidoreductase